MDLYLLLEIEQDADDKAIRKAYRKKALTCHPDKNPDDKVSNIKVSYEFQNNFSGWLWPSCVGSPSKYYTEKIEIQCHAQSHFKELSDSNYELNHCIAIYFFFENLFCAEIHWNRNKIPIAVSLRFIALVICTYMFLSLVNIRFKFSKKRKRVI